MGDVSGADLRLSSYDFPLPEERSAQRPVEPRHAARLLAVRGGMLTDHGVRDLAGLLQPGDVPDAIDAVRREHSRKPIQMREMIDRLLPRSYFCELFGREPWAGHDVWGNEVGKFLPAQSGAV
jgi:N6-adenosine-specific RNA methylase IME4